MIARVESKLHKKYQIAPNMTRNRKFERLHHHCSAKALWTPLTGKKVIHRISNRKKTNDEVMSVDGEVYRQF